MNNPLIFTDPSGYMPDWVQDEYDHYYRNGGGGGGGFNYFGWISRSMSYVGWTDNVGPSRADYDYWAANIKGNAAFGEAANSVGKWYQNRRNLNVNWDIALEMGMDFLSTAYQYGGNDVFYTNSSGRSGYLRSKFAVLADYYSDLALLSYMEQIIQSPRNYGMMMGDPEKIPWNGNNNKLMAAHLIEWIRYSEHTGNGVFDIRDAFSGIKPWSDGNSYGISFFALDLEVNGVKLGFQANVFINSAPNGSWNSEVCFGSGESYHSYVGKDGRWWRLNRLDSHKGSSWGTQEMNFQHLYDYLYK